MKIGVYIQVPFCQTKCTYCNFHTGVFSSELYGPYVDAIVREISEHDALYHKAGVASETCRCAASSVVDTVYIGGGTPSLLEPSALARVMDALRGSFACSLEEVTLEADPETITLEKAEAWRAAGINRISMGTQSFNDRELAAAGRLHRRSDIYAADKLLRAAGINNLNCDLIAGLPHQTEESWRRTINELLALQPEHISIYMLEIDEGSRLGREALAGGKRYSATAIPGDDSIADFYEHACVSLAESGYEHYEISNWGKKGFHSRHNLKYWKRHPYFGIGAGAHSFDGAMRWANAHDPAAYAASVAGGQLPIEQNELLSDQQALDEELFLGLRLLDGIDWKKLELRYNADLRARVDRYVEQGLLMISGDNLRLSPSRIAISNEVFVGLLT
jgi:oxygen-independent coproporphyrinogen-3 oxidase